MPSRPSFQLSPDAQSDLKGIRYFTIENWGQQQAEKYLNEIRSTMQMLAESPQIGLQHPELGEDIYSFPHASHAIYFSYLESEVVIFAVLHKSMVPLKHLEKRTSG